MDAANAGPHLGAGLQELEEDGGDSGIGELGTTQAGAAQGVDEHMGHGGEPQAHLVGRHGRGRGAIGEEFELFANAVPGLGPGAIEIFIGGAGVGEVAFERGDDEAGVGSLQGVLGLSDDPASAAPALERAMAEVAEHPGRLARGEAHPGGASSTLSGLPVGAAMDRHRFRPGACRSQSASGDPSARARRREAEACFAGTQRIKRLVTNRRLNRRMDRRGLDSGPERLGRVTPRELRQVLQLHELFVTRRGGKRASLSGRDLSGVDLRNCNLAEADLSCAHLARADLRGALLRDAELTCADLRAANLDDADLSGADLRSSCLRGAQLNGAKLPRADLRKANYLKLVHNADIAVVDGAAATDLTSVAARACDFSDARLVGAAFLRADLTDADFTAADLSGADLRSADATGAMLARANLAGADLSGAVLLGAVLLGANLAGSRFTNADISGCVLDRAALQLARDPGGIAGADPPRPTRGELDEILRAHAQWIDSRGATGRRASLGGCDLSRIDLPKARLALADMSRTILHGANLQGASLTMADLSLADLREARLDGADLRGARLTRAHLGGASLVRADLSPLENVGGASSDFPTNLEGARLAGADLRGANLHRTRRGPARSGGRDVAKGTAEPPARNDDG